MARPKVLAPALRYHISGQAVVTLDGRDIYLGKYDSAESLAKYAVLIGIYQSNALNLPEDFDVRHLDSTVYAIVNPISILPQHQESQPVSVKHVTAAYRDVVKTKYRNQRAEKLRCIQVCDELDQHDGGRLACEYGPLSLARQRDRWVDSGKARVYCNRLTKIVCRVFKHAVSQEIVDENVWRRLLSVEALRRGQTSAPETVPVQPVAISDVAATALELSPILRAMVRIHVATGMRPSELCCIRPCDVDRTGDCWIYRPPEHKNSGRGKTRAIPLLGDARVAISDYLDRPQTSYCFSPREAVEWSNAMKRLKRKSKVQPSQRDRSKPSPEVEPGMKYEAGSYRRAIQRAAKRAGVASWFPYQLRHLALTEVRNALGGEAAQALGGHSRMDMTEHYARLNESKAIEAAMAAPSLFPKGVSNDK